MYEITFAAYTASMFSIVFVSTVFHDGATWCMVQCGSIFAVFHFSWRVFPWCFPGCSFEVCWSALMLLVTFVASRFYSAGKAVCFWVCVCVSVSLPVHYDPPLYSGTRVTVFSILLHSAACLSWMWFCRFHSCRSLPSFIEKFLRHYCFCESVDLIGPISHAWFSWETLPHAELWLIAQLSLLFLSDVL